MCGQLSAVGRRHVLPFSEVEQFITAQSITAERIYLWGGEPLLHPDVTQFIKLFKERGSIVALNTNGWRLEERLEELVASGLDRLILSIDGANAETHDKIRGLPGSFAQIVRCLLLWQTQVPAGAATRLRVNFVVLPNNYRQILDMAQWCFERGINKMHFQLPIFITNEQAAAYQTFIQTVYNAVSKDYRAFIKSYEGIDFDALANSMAQVKLRYGSFARFHPFDALGSEDLQKYFLTYRPICEGRCGASIDKLVIDSSGRLVICPDFPDLSYGDVVRGPLKTSSVSSLRTGLQQAASLPICPRCCHFSPIMKEAR